MGKWGYNIILIGANPPCRGSGIMFPVFPWCFSGDWGSSWDSRSPWWADFSGDPGDLVRGICRDYNITSQTKAGTIPGFVLAIFFLPIG